MGTRGLLNSLRLEDFDLRNLELNRLGCPYRELGVEQGSPYRELGNRLGSQEGKNSGMLERNQEGKKSKTEQRKQKQKNELQRDEHQHTARQGQ